MTAREYLVVLPTYNERDNIARIVDRVLAATDAVDVLVIDDGSPDGTSDVVRGLEQKYGDRVKMIERPQKSGLGSAYRVGMRYALEGAYLGVFTMDADNSHDPARMPTMIAALANADLVIGSRYVRGGATDQGAIRRVNSLFANVLARLILNLGVKDCTSGYRLYGRELLARMPIVDMRSQGYSTLVELLCVVLDANGRVVEIPISFLDRSEGTSKVAPSEIWESLRTIARLRRGRFGSVRTRVLNLVYRALPLRNKER